MKINPVNSVPSNSNQPDRQFVKPHSACFMQVQDFKDFEQLASLQEVSQKFFFDWVNWRNQEGKIEHLDFKQLEIWGEESNFIETLVEKCPDLKSLNLGQFKDDNIPHLLKLKKLEALTFMGLDITSKTVERLSDFVNLKRLKLAYCLIGENLSLSSLSKLKNLTHLDLSDVEIKPEHLKDLDLPSLEYLNLEDSEITDETLKQLSRFKKLSFLKIPFCLQITDAGLEHLQSSHIKYLDLSGCNITDQGLKTLSKLGLIALNVKHCKNITRKGLSSFSSTTELTLPHFARY